MTTHAKAIFEIRSWDEKPYFEEGGMKLTRASVSKIFRGDITGEAVSESLMSYHADGSAAFTGLERVVGAIGGKKGSFVLEARGTYQNGTATCELRVIPGSGAGELRDLRGEGRYVATHADYPNVPVELDCRF